MVRGLFVVYGSGHRGLCLIGGQVCGQRLANQSALADVLSFGPGTARALQSRLNTGRF